ncbi:MAG: hypothetical protein CVU17_04940 [Betaproteobacteria bacterium HGW-Betaproteobacteria-11]|nr:MAG: hypothetical protein CVU17_04940 [Betaproteobacteria bacterium HGW-Betaproteobacteria-11]
MEPSPTKSALHPLVLIASLSVIAVSLAGVGYFAGWLPGSGGKPAESSAALGTPPATNDLPPAATPSASAPTVATQTKEVKSAAKPRKQRAAVSPAPTSARSTSASAACADCGIVAAVNEVMVEPEGSGVGAVAGGVAGGVLGNQIGRGDGRTVATVLGVVGGAVAGNAIEKSVKKTKRYDVVVRFNDGTTRTFSSTTLPEWRSGDRVRVQNGVLTPRN